MSTEAAERFLDNVFWIMFAGVCVALLVWLGVTLALIPNRCEHEPLVADPERNCIWMHTVNGGKTCWPLKEWK